MDEDRFWNYLEMQRIAHESDAYFEKIADRAYGGDVITGKDGHSVTVPRGHGLHLCPDCHGNFSGGDSSEDNTIIQDNSTNYDTCHGCGTKLHVKHCSHPDLQRTDLDGKPLGGPGSEADKAREIPESGLVNADGSVNVAPSGTCGDCDRARQGVLEGRGLTGESHSVHARNNWGQAGYSDMYSPND